MNKCNPCSIPCPTICCQEKGEDLLRVYKEIDTPCTHIHVEGQVTDAGSIECRPAKMHISTAEAITHLQYCNLKLERQLACHIPHYLNKITNKSHVHYSGPVRAKQASIRHDECGNITINYDFFYVPTRHLSS